MVKKILIVDDSALMRRMICDIIASDSRFEVADIAANGVEALELLSKNTYDAVVLDAVMPQMDGLTLLKELNARNIRAKILMNSTLTKEGGRVTIQALENGALDFVHKPNGIFDERGREYKEQFLKILGEISYMRMPRQISSPAMTSTSAKTTVPVKPVTASTQTIQANATPNVQPSTVTESVKNALGATPATGGKKIIAIASSTGGPKALQDVIPRIPAQIDAPIVIVQHMPAGFTASLAERLDTLSEVSVKEAEEGDILEKGHVYIAKGGMHLKVVNKNGKHQLTLTDEPTREGVKPCANYMYESLMDSGFEHVCCVVMTGMGADATEGILNLQKRKKTHIIAQSEETCAVYGMPKSIVNKGVVNEVLPLKELAQATIKNVGVN